MRPYFVVCPALFFIGVLNLATVKVPDGVSPVEFWAISLGVAVAVLGVFGLAVAGFTHRKEKVRELAWYGFGLAGVSLLLGLAFLVMPSPIVGSGPL